MAHLCAQPTVCLKRGRAFLGKKKVVAGVKGWLNDGNLPWTDFLPAWQQTYWILRLWIFRMISQEFTSKNLLKLLHQADPVRWAMGRSKGDYIATLQGVEEKLGNPGYSLSKFKVYERKGRILVPSNIQDEFAIRKVNDTVKRIFGVRQQDRTEIVRQLSVLLKEPARMSIIRLDIKSFFESVERDSLIERVLKNHMVSYDTKRVFRAIFNSPDLQRRNGLPRGICLSSSLAEMYMHEFDRYARSADGVYFYARYVDDIFILCISDPDDVIRLLEKGLPKGLLFSDDPEKRYVVELAASGDGSVEEVSYLGYKFIIDSSKKSKRDLKITISDNKVRKIKTRICLAFNDFIRNGDASLLEKRLKFLASNFSIKSQKRSNKKINVGIYYNYKISSGEFDKKEALIQLDIFLNKMIHSVNGSYGKRLSPKLTPVLKSRLSKISFLKGYMDAMKIKVSASEARTIGMCWGHVA